MKVRAEPFAAACVVCLVLASLNRAKRETMSALALRLTRAGFDASGRESHRKRELLARDGQTSCGSFRMHCASLECPQQTPTANAPHLPSKPPDALNLRTLNYALPIFSIPQPSKAWRDWM